MLCCACPFGHMRQQDDAFHYIHDRVRHEEYHPQFEAVCGLDEPLAKVGRVDDIRVVITCRVILAVGEHLAVHLKDIGWEGIQPVVKVQEFSRLCRQDPQSKCDDGSNQAKAYSHTTDTVVGGEPLFRC